MEGQWSKVAEVKGWRREGRGKGEGWDFGCPVQGFLSVPEGGHADPETLTGCCEAHLPSPHWAGVPSVSRTG